MKVQNDRYETHWRGWAGVVVEGGGGDGGGMLRIFAMVNPNTKPKIEDRTHRHRGDKIAGRKISSVCGDET
jgi:hypothetical protein